MTLSTAYKPSGYIKKPIERVVCALDGCDVVFVKKTHNQKYCCNEHLRIGNIRENCPPPKKLETLACANCGKIFEQKATYQKYCSNECCEYADKENTMRGRYIIFERDNFKCFYCGRTSYGDGVKLHVDHVRPLLLGGDDKAYNLVTACQECNIQKGTIEIKNPGEVLEEIERRNNERNIPGNTVIKLNQGYRLERIRKNAALRQAAHDARQLDR